MLAAGFLLGILFALQARERFRRECETRRCRPMQGAH